MNVKVWYSAATDVTGKKIAESLEAISSGTKKPTGNTPILCWGAKTKEDVDLDNTQVYNHPNNIRLNRHKFKSLTKMQAANVPVSPFTSNTQEAINLGFPLVARTNYHQGGSGFWLCLNTTHLTNAMDEGAQYFQKYINIKTEYRLHVVKDDVIYAVKKIKRPNLKEAFKTHWKEVIENYATKKDVTLNKDTMDFVLNRFARKMAAETDMITRSNTRGWKFSKIKVANLNTDLKKAAVDAVKALNLDFGAVDCCIDEEGNVFIIEVNTGPGLEGSSLEAWITALKKLITKPKKTAGKVTKTTFKAIKEDLLKKTKAFRQMLETAEDPEQIDLLKEMWAKM